MEVEQYPYKKRAQKHRENATDKKAEIGIMQMQAKELMPRLMTATRS